ncbi:MAG: methyltransferase domain-containing protein [Chloroflexota bacterium]
MTDYNTTPPICDYEGSTYRTDFWENRGRDYEDRVERVALDALLPFGGGRRLLEIGAGYGRLTNMYHAYEQVVVMDYSLSHVQQAAADHGHQQRYVYVAADVYNLPFRPGVFDGATMIRVIHHLREVPLAMTQVRNVLAPKGVFVLEHANKRNLKAILRYATGQQDWNPYTRAPHEFVELNIDFHPSYITDELQAADFAVVRRVPVSYLRLGALKRSVPTDALVALDRVLQQTALFYSPSIFTKNIAMGDTPDNTGVALSEPDALFVAPGTGNPLRREGDTMVDTITGTRWAVRDGIYDFKAPLE